MLFGRKGRNQQLLPKANAAITVPTLPPKSKGGISPNGENQWKPNGLLMV